MTRTKKLLAMILCAVLTLLSVPGFTVETAEPAIYYEGPVRTDDTYGLPQTKTGFFEFESNRKNYSHKFDFYYNDVFFSGSAYDYNHDLSKMSLRLAMAAFGVIKKNANGDIDYSGQYRNAYSLMRQMGFSDYAYNEYYMKKPKSDSIAVSAASKRVRYSDGNYTLIAVGVRGANYENEWGGNFRIGTEDLHEGFRNASRRVVSFLQEYIKGKNITGNVKLWITGFSRAAATTNVTAARLDEEPGILGGEVNLLPENIYAYCFETPAGVRFDGNDKLYGNIFSIVNYNDPVPKVVMEEWGYWRRGNTLFLPSKLWTSPDKYKRLSMAMRTKYDQYCSEEYRKDKYNLENFETQGVTLDSILDKAAKIIGSPSNYAQKYQELFVDIGENIIGEGKAADFIGGLNKAMSRRGGMLYVIGDTIWSLFRKSTRDLGEYRKLRASLTEAFWAAGIQQPVSGESLKLLTDLIYDIGLTDLIQIYSNADKLGAAHYPELCLAWLDAISGNDLYDGSTRRVYFNAKDGGARSLGLNSGSPGKTVDDLEVYDSNGKLVAAVYDGEIHEIPNGLLSYIDENGQAVVYIPVDGEYTTRVVSESDGRVSYSVQENNPGEVTEIVSYTADVDAGDIFTGIATVMTDGDGEYTFEDNGGGPVSLKALDEDDSFSIEAKIEGAGNVTGGGSLHTGEWAGLTASPLDGERFLGWYEGGRLVSAEPVLRFDVTGDRDLTAIFSDELCDVIFVSGDDVLGSQRFKKGSAPDFDAVNPSSGYVIDGFYLDPDMTVPVDDTTVFSGDADIYVKQTERTEPGIAYVNAVKDGDRLAVNFLTEMVPDGAPAYAAAYTGDGRMTAAVRATAISGSFTASLPAENAAIVRVFVWDDVKNLTPLCQAAEAEILEP